MITARRVLIIIWKLMLCALLLAVPLAAPAAPAPGTLIDPSRRIDWEGHAGVPGGIPNRTTICTTINAATYGAGNVDASAAISMALRNCPANQVVFLPQGNYRLNNSIDFDKSNVTLRGAGPGKTILTAVGSAAGITTSQNGYSAERGILSGAAKGSNSIVVRDASGITAGTIIDIYQANDPDFYWSRWGATDRTGQIAMVTAVNGTTLQLEDPLIWNFNQNPRFRYQLYPTLSGIGLEDLTVTGNSSYDGNFIEFWQTYASWIKNVETSWGNGNAHIQLFGCLRNEIRDSHIHDTHSTSDGYGIITLASSDIAYGHGGCTGTLIENNVFDGLWYAMVLETEAASVIGYNYAFNNRFAGWPNYQMQDYNNNHGPHGMMMLFEGNLGVGFQSDGYHGSTSHTTLFRNWFSGQHVDANRTGNIKLVDLCRFSLYTNVVGNVLGFSGWPRTTTGRYEMTGTPDYTEQSVIYRLGYPNMGNNGYSPTNPPSNGDDGGLDPRVKSTLMRWGNFDFQNNTTRWDASEIPGGVPVPTTQTLPASLYYSSTPSWWPAGVAWPVIGPDVSGGQNAAGRVYKIPAQFCYEQGKMPNCLQSGGTPDTQAPSVPKNLRMR